MYTKSMLPLKRVIASAIRSCADEALSSRNRRWRSASILRSRTGARPRSGGGGEVGLGYLPLLLADILGLLSGNARGSSVFRVPVSLHGRQGASAQLFTGGDRKMVSPG